MIKDVTKPTMTRGCISYKLTREEVLTAIKKHLRTNAPVQGFYVDSINYTSSLPFVTLVTDYQDGEV